MSILLFFLWLFLYLVYFAVKGIRTVPGGGSGPLKGITVVAWVLNILVINNLLSGIWMAAVFAYYVLSILDYFNIHLFSLENVFPKKAFNFLFSKLHIRSEEVEIKYYIFKPPFTFLINLIILFMSGKWINYYDGFDVHVKNENNIIDIKF